MISPSLSANLWYNASMKTPEGKTIVFTFMSQPTSDPKGCRVAKLTFPGGSDENSGKEVEEDVRAI